MKDLLLIGIGAGDPRQVTYEAVDALRSASVFFVLDKGDDKDELVRLRKAILQRYRPEVAIAWCRWSTLCAMGRRMTTWARCSTGTGSVLRCMRA